MFPYKITTVHQLEPKDWDPRAAISQSRMENMSSDPVLLLGFVFLMNRSFTSRDLKTLRTFVFTAQETVNIQQQEHDSKMYQCGVLWTQLRGTSI